LSDKKKLMKNREYVLSNVGLKNFSNHLLSIIKNVLR